MLRDDMCYGETSVGGRRCESGAFRLHVNRSRRTVRLYVESQCISPTLQDIEYLSRMFCIVQQQLRDYVLIILCPRSWLIALSKRRLYVRNNPSFVHHVMLLPRVSLTNTTASCCN